MIILAIRKPHLRSCWWKDTCKRYNLLVDGPNKFTKHVLSGWYVAAGRDSGYFDPDAFTLVPKKVTKEDFL